MLCASGFVNGIMLSYDGLNRPESKTTRVFRAVRQVAAPGAKSAVLNCRLLDIALLLLITSVVHVNRASGCVCALVHLGPIGQVQRSR